MTACCWVHQHETGIRPCRNFSETKTFLSDPTRQALGLWPCQTPHIALITKVSAMGHCSQDVLFLGMQLTRLKMADKGFPDAFCSCFATRRQVRCLNLSLRWDFGCGHIWTQSVTKMADKGACSGLLPA